MRRFFRPIPLGIAALVFLLAYTLIGFFLLPYVIKSYVFPKISEQMGRPVLVKEVEVNPFILSLRLTGFEIQEKDKSPLIGFDEFFVNIQSVSLIHRAYVFETIRFAIPFVSVKVARNGLVNLADLIPPNDSPEAPKPTQDTDAPSEIPAVEIGRFEIAQGIVEFRDESKTKPFMLDIVPINIVLDNFHTKAGGDNTYAFTAELGKDKTLAWEGKLSIQPIQTEGKLSFRGLNLPRLWQYMQEDFRFTIANGTLAADGRYRFDASVSPPNVTIADATLEMADIAIVEEGTTNPVITIPALNVEGIQLDHRARSVSIGSVNVADAVWTAWLNADGTVNYQSLLAPVKAEPTHAPSSPSPQVSPAAEKEESWTVTLKEASLKNHAIHFEDRSLRSPMRAEISGLTVHTHDVAIPMKEPIPLSVELALNETGKIKVDGQIAVKPFQTDLTLGLRQIAIKPFEPYFEKVARLTVESGDIDLNGDLHLAMEHANVPLMTYRGDLGIRGLAIADRDEGASVASWKQLQLKHIVLAIDPTTVTIEEVGLDQPAVHLVVLSDGQLNLKKLRPEADEVSPASKPQNAPSTSKKGAPPSIAVKTVKLLKGSATFVDESIQPTVRTGIYDLTGTIRGLSSKQLAKADVAISGRVDKVAPLKISGTINPLSEDTFTDLSVKFDNVDLTTAAPYSGKYAGYPIRKGKLFLDIAYKISKKQLEAENKVAIDQFTFGEKTNSPDATSLPVPLAVALLKDRNGRIDIDLPIRGDLNDPDFKYGKVVISTLVNLLTKLVASPFGLMGKLIPGGGTGEDLQFMEFLPGSSVMSAEERKKAEALAKALEERPGLRLDVTGAADPVRDRQALGLQKLSEELRARWNREHGKPPANAEPLPADEERRLVVDLYERRRSKERPPEPTSGSPVPPRSPTIDQMMHELVAAMPPDEDGLRALARRRGEEIRNELTGQGKLAEERVYLVDVDLTASDHDKVRSQLAISAAP